MNFEQHFFPYFMILLTLLVGGGVFYCRLIIRKIFLVSLLVLFLFLPLAVSHGPVCFLFLYPFLLLMASFVFPKNIKLIQWPDKVYPVILFILYVGIFLTIGFFVMVYSEVFVFHEMLTPVFSVLLLIMFVLAIHSFLYKRRNNE